MCVILNGVKNPPQQDMKIVKEQMDELRKLSVAMRQDLPILELEKLEDRFKFLVRTLVGENFGNDSIALEIACIQKEMGLLCKYKSYGIKACTPLGYAIFLLNPGEGFSFQNHLDFKVELFYILDVSNGGYVYISTSEEWNQVFNEEKFRRWLAGDIVPEYEVFKKYVKSGDVIKIDKVGIVHSAIGCVLEEYANVSTDMVQRLYDQNKGKPIPKKCSRELAKKQIESIVFPMFANDKSSPTEFGIEMVLNESDEFIAKRISIYPSKQQMIKTQDQYFSLYITQGEGNLFVAESSSSISLSKGDPVLLVPNSQWILKNSFDIPLQYSLLAVAKKSALK